MKDHRDIGRDQSLFFFHPLSPGSPCWLPKGVTLMRTLKDWMRKNLVGYEELSLPVMWKADLYKTSGHWDHFRQNMFAFASEGPSQDCVLKFCEPDYALKPMNCPGAMLVYKSRGVSYRDLPLRYLDFGTLHRNEVSGALGGLFRCREFHQDDAHIFLARDQIVNEIARLVELVYNIYQQFGMKVSAKLSTRPKEFMGDPEVWRQAEDILKVRLSTCGYELAEGEGAFYGPKIDFTVKDNLGRDWQTATIQLDFQLPERFDLWYTDADGKPARPIVIHRAIFGSFERFVGVLLEHYDGALPSWLAPIQVAVLPVSAKFKDFADSVNLMLNDRLGIRAVVDASNETLSHRIALWQSQQVPYLMVLGQKERETGKYSLRDRSGKVETVHDTHLEDFVKGI